MHHGYCCYGTSCCYNLSLRYKTNGDFNSIFSQSVLLLSIFIFLVKFVSISCYTVEKSRFHTSILQNNKCTRIHISQNVYYPWQPLASIVFLGNNYFYLFFFHLLSLNLNVEHLHIDKYFNPLTTIVAGYFRYIKPVSQCSERVKKSN